MALAWKEYEEKQVKKIVASGIFLSSMAMMLVGCGGPVDNHPPPTATPQPPTMPRKRPEPPPLPMEPPRGLPYPDKNCVFSVLCEDVQLHRFRELSAYCGNQGWLGIPMTTQGNTVRVWREAANPPDTFLSCVAEEDTSSFVTWPWGLGEDCVAGLTWTATCTLD